ncbi:MAG: DUF4091 domain-containing protein [Phaeodactylibacter sp.]|nr:DUF4091 domain-containing protein [Phaeodactylibacter sp.]MCB9273540.1 DUF4091 domain-containing protein [Lewinellaceae bacterium]
MRYLIICSLFTILILGGVSTANSQSTTGAALLEAHYVDPLEKVFRETAFFMEEEALAEVARGEHASLQFAVRCAQPVQGLKAKVDFIRQGSSSLLPDKVGYVGYVKVGRSTPRPSRDRLLPMSGLYPDPILEQETIDLPAFATQPVWISVPIPLDASPGIYEGQVTFSGMMNGWATSTSRPFRIRVYPVNVEKTSLWVTNWYTLSPNVLAHLNGGEPVEAYTDAYWKYARLLARTMAAYAQNMALVNPLQHTEFSMQKGQYAFDFTRFDQTVQLFIDEGVVGRIEGGHIGRRASDWTSPFVVGVPVVENDSTYFLRLPISDDKAKSFYSQFFPALVQHLRDKGWYSIYTQHIADEPIDENFQSYIDIARFIKSLAPDIKIIEATHSKNLNNLVDVWVPQLNFFADYYDFYKERMGDGDEAWFYTCLAPQEEYANRFIELPLIKTRILHWINYRYDSPGYLHWGFNFWRNDDPFGETTGIIVESGNVLPGGDAWICYPARDKILSSIRLEAMRDGIYDYELLKMAAVKDPEKIKELARQVVYRFDLYDMNVQAFREKRRMLLELLSE